MKFVRFMTGIQGRSARTVMGGLLFLLGQFVIQGTPGTFLSIIAFVPIAAGVLDFCLVGVILGYPFSGEKARQQIATEEAHRRT